MVKLFLHWPVILKMSDMADQVTARGYRIVAKIYTNKQLEKFSTTYRQRVMSCVLHLMCNVNTIPYSILPKGV